LPFYSSRFSDGTRIINLIPFAGSFDENGGFMWGEIRDNILIFVPLGMYICMLKNELSFLNKLLPIVGLTFAIESIQFIFALGRSDITDIIDNTLGGLIGIGIYAVALRILGGRTNKIFLILAFIVTAIVLWQFGDLFFRSWFGMRRTRF
jgi:glycopeptide antibiotics resistance protein